ncbi:CPBP family intramembrane metalloprotease [Paenibacillus chitinolyticus]|uniref:CPBP family intramembrane metalloprotease n=1 Tax=Paenibacillus chitinolyticus TaxID=79263 RepID=A0A410X2J7_9BACL|nr:CPBP family intramembrane glutamic endopeptidase [Paenibacillus chitinolyticus]MCY9591413.1 lysostaphin resistance A-like protein [Paenibacillus chitinolyticus]MCY9599402.1 lysostaphin resistance A-like protein [Paenibacillus chitinolyticus]QAV20844.1 CPBP family intramembrane metalloprotease [Paenibacillus chitinolyticus]
MKKYGPDKPLLLLALTGFLLYAAVVFIYNAGAAPAGSGPYETAASITKEQAAEAAVAWLRQRQGADAENGSGAVTVGGSPGTFVSYQSEKELSGYLTKDKLQTLYDKSYASRVPVDYYRVEVAEASPSVRKWIIDIHMTTKAVIGWSRIGGEALAAVSASDAEKAAREAIARHGYEEAEFKRISPPAAMSGMLLFEREKEPVGDAKLTIGVKLDGTSVSSFTQSFRLPAAFTSWLKHQEDTASMWTRISLWGNGLMALIALGYTVLKWRTVDFSRGVLLTAVYAVIYVMNNINMYPAYKAGSTPTSSGQEAILSIMLINFVTLLMAAAVYFSFTAGEALWRREGKSVMPRWRDADFGARITRSMVQGYLLCLFLLGLQQVLFLVAEKGFGVWSVNDPMSSPRNMLQPALLPLMAWAAGISEEATFRLLGIALFSRLLRFKWLAVLLPSLIWAAGHTAYPIYPVYTRLIEVTVLGLVFGYAFLRYGFLTALFAHTAMDSILMGLSLLTGEGLAASTPALGLLYMALPAAVALAVSWLHKLRFVSGSRQNRRPV